MQITSITKTTTKTSVIVSALVSMQGDKPERIYFSVPKAFAQFIALDGSPFFAAMLIPALRRHEDVVVFGSLSQQLFTNTAKIMKLFKTWKWMHRPVSLAAGEKTVDRVASKYVAAFFSGGVDSFFTLLRHKREITHLILVQGFDIETSNNTLFKKTLANCQAIAKASEVTVIPVTTNCKQLMDRYTEWDYTHGGALAGVALLLRRGFKKVYIPGSLPKEKLFPYGTHPALDPLWGTETLRLVDDGLQFSRQEKITKVVAKSALAHQYLRVCAQNIKGKYNCSGCFKCTRTMLEFAIAGKLEKLQTFTHQFNPKAIESFIFDPKLGYETEAKGYITELTKQRKYPDVVKALRIALYNTNHPSLLKRSVYTLAQIDKRYNRRQVYQYIFGLTKHQDRRLAFKLLAAKGLIK